MAEAAWSQVRMGSYTLTAEQRRLKAKVYEQLLDARRALLICQPFIGALAMRLILTPVCDDRVTSFCSDGTHLYVDVEYFHDLKEKERIALIAHEVWHCALLHFLRRGDREEERFNHAIDIEVGLLLKKAHLPVDMPLYEKAWKGMSAEQIYERLPATPAGPRSKDIHLYPQKTIPGVLSLTAGDNEDDGNGSHDSIHGSEGDNNNSSRSLLNGGSGSESAGNGKDAGTCSRGDANFASRAVPAEDQMRDPDFAPSGQDAELKMKWHSAVQQEAARCKSRGTLPAEIEKLIAPSDRTPKDWKQILLDFVTLHLGGERQWLPPNRRYVYKKLYLPSRARKMEIELVIAIDTSGSTVSDFPDFITELQGLVESFGDYTITVIQCDTKIHSVEEYSSNSGKEFPEEGIKLQGTGGTDLRPPFEYITKNMPNPPVVMIYLTDGEGPAPLEEPNYPVIWCLTAEGKKPTNWGIAVNMENKQT